MRSVVDRLPWLHLSWLGFLGLASGLPLLLTTSTLQVWLADQLPTMATASLGAISLLGLPYLFKGLWAPFLDQHRLPWFAHREGWVVWMELLIALALLAMAYLGVAYTHGLVVLAFIIACASATQDAALDAHRIESTHPSHYGLASSAYQLGYRLAMMLAGGGALLLADQWGWSRVYQCFALLCVLIAIWVGSVGLRRRAHVAHLAPKAPWWSVIKGCVALPCVGAGLLLVMALKVSDAMITNLAQVFFLKALHLSLTDIGFLYKIIGLICTIAGAIIAGFTLKYYPIKYNLYAMAGLQLLAILPYIVCALPADHTQWWVVIAVMAESLTSGMIGSACIVLLMLLCGKRFVATEYAVLALFALLPRIALGAPAGWWVDHWGWLSFFSMAAVLAMLPFLCFASACVKRLWDYLDKDL